MRDPPGCSPHVLSKSCSSLPILDWFSLVLSTATSATCRYLLCASWNLPEQSQQLQARMGFQGNLSASQSQVFRAPSPKWQVKCSFMTQRPRDRYPVSDLPIFSDPLSGALKPDYSLSVSLLSMMWHVNHKTTNLLS